MSIWIHSLVSNKVATNGPMDWSLESRSSFPKYGIMRAMTSEPFSGLAFDRYALRS